MTVAIDHPGTGDSDGDGFETLERLAAIDVAAARLCLDGLRDGTLVPGIAPVPEARAYAMGQSMGGYLLVLMQAADPFFRAIALLGAGMQGVTFPVKAPSGETVRLTASLPPKTNGATLSIGTMTTIARWPIRIWRPGAAHALPNRHGAGERYRARWNGWCSRHR